MRTPASIFNHPIHPMLIVFPIGLWIFSLICDLIRLGGGTSGDAWSAVALYSMVGGFIGALRAPFGPVSGADNATAVAAAPVIATNITRDVALHRLLDIVTQPPSHGSRAGRRQSGLATRRMPI